MNVAPHEAAVLLKNRLNPRNKPQLDLQIEHDGPRVMIHPGMLYGPANKLKPGLHDKLVKAAVSGLRRSTTYKSYVRDYDQTRDTLDQYSHNELHELLTSFRMPSFSLHGTLAAEAFSDLKAEYGQRFNKGVETGDSQTAILEAAEKMAMDLLKGDRSLKHKVTWVPKGKNAHPWVEVTFSEAK